ncbi:MAG: hypothetical protein GAK31_03496 [Stenotrophomonas maltophilia]|uniref:Tetratricopeptide repeat protein n=1 Tax=Stenotrophomonas maltophilia TaxID=40324 RepID=A0A7V8FDQ5_STEMA|nr:MAG: hypothetical protein GAK31_03496 [Stenotrophomonas maltophilia]
MMFSGLRVAALMLAAGTTTAWAATGLPAPQEFYFEKDAAAAPVMVVAPGADPGALVAQLIKQRERDRKVAEATVQLADVAIAQGRAEQGDNLYSDALAEWPAASSNGRVVRWNHGWSLLRRGQMDAALGQWQAATSGLRGNPSWLPPTYALALWRLGEKGEAVKWYAAAVRTEPTLWSDASHYASLLPDWHEDERATLGEVQAAWLAQPPAWP